MKQSFFSKFSKVVFAAAYVAMVSPMASAYAASGFPTATGQNAENSAEQQLLLADDNDGDDDGDDDDGDDNEMQQVQVELPESVKTAVLQDVSQRSGVAVSSLRVLQAEKQTWSDGCLGLGGTGVSCTQATVPGWAVVVASDRQVWVYRTNESGTVARLDEATTQAVTARLERSQTATSQQTTSQQTTSRTTVQQRQTTVQQRSSQMAASRVSVKGKKTGFALAIWQPSSNFSEVIARVSVKGKRGSKGYLKERYLGDYRYKMKSKAQFVKGLKAGDRVVVRLYDTQNRFIGYSEFEALSANTAVNLVLSGNPTEYKVVRTVYGVDANMDGQIDAGTTSYDYFTQVSQQQVTFLSSSQQIRNASQFQVQELSAVAATSVYPTSFTQGQYTLARKSVSAFSSDLAAALKAAPGQLVQVSDVSQDDSSTYDIGKLLRDYRDVGVSAATQVVFSDVSTNHWARDFIAELAALEIVEGFPDNTFRPDEPVTRAQFSAMLRKAFEKAKIRQATNFRDVSSRYWAYTAIREAYTMGFLNAVAGNEFNPTQSLSRADILVALAQGLGYKPTASVDTILAAYSDSTTIRSDYRTLIAALTERGVVVNYPDVKLLNAEKVATRAEVCALLYQALVSTGEVVNMPSQYVVGETEDDDENEVEEVNYENEGDDDDGGDDDGGDDDRGDDDDETVNRRRNCNQGIGNGAEGCDPGNSRPHGGTNDENGRTPGGRK